MRFLTLLAISLSGVQASASSGIPLHCADRQSYAIRVTTTVEGCLDNELSLGASAITRPKNVVTGLHPKVELRFKVARAAAKTEGVHLYIASVFRSYERQTYLFNRAIKRHGSYDEAIKWVAPPEISRHPRGLAMDINYPADPEGAKWLEIYGYRYGLCRVFENEWWHFEAVTAPGETCPVMYANSAVRG